MYENGGAIGVELIRGDISAQGLGTVTYVEGDKLVAMACVPSEPEAPAGDANAESGAHDTPETPAARSEDNLTPPADNSPADGSPADESAAGESTAGE